MPEKEKGVIVFGTILEALGDNKFRVKLDNDIEVKGYLAGKLRKFKIKVIVGDRVQIELSPYEILCF